MRAPPWMPFRTPLAFGLGLGLALAGPFMGLGLIKSVLVRIDEQALVHPDRTRFESGERTVTRPVRFLFSAGGERRHADLAPADAAAFAASFEGALARQRSALEARIERMVESALAPIERGAENRIEAYADWYFAWPTAYRLAGVAALSVVDHAVELRVSSLRDAVEFDLARHLRRHYEERVLEPEITQAKLERAFIQTLNETREAYAEAAAAILESSRRELLARAAPLRPTASDAAAPVVTVDWDSQLHKLKVVGHERGGADAALRGALVGAAGAVGVRSATSFGAALAASRLPAVAGAHALRPAAGRGLARLGLQAAGAGVAGPLGFAVGVGTGLLIDLGVNEAEEALRRDAFEASIRGSVQATFDDLRHAMRDELRRTADVWFEDAHAVLQLRLR